MSAAVGGSCFAVLCGQPRVGGDESRGGNSMRSLLRRVLSGLHTVLILLLILPFYLTGVLIIVLAHYIWKLDIDTGPPDYIRH